MWGISTQELILQVRDPLDPEQPVCAWVAVSIRPREDDIEIHCTFQQDSGRGKTATASFAADKSRGNYGEGFRNVECVRLAGKSDAGDFEIPEAFRGLRIGSWIMSRTIHWAKQWPDLAVMPILVGTSDGELENDTRRFRLWTRCGYRFHEFDGTRGWSDVGRVRDMTAPTCWQKNITVMSPDDFRDYVANSIEANREIRASRTHDLNLLSSMEDWLERHTLRFALGGTFFAFCRPPAFDETQAEDSTPAIPHAAPSCAAEALRTFYQLLDGDRSHIECMKSEIDYIYRCIINLAATPFSHFWRKNKNKLLLRSLIAASLLIVLLSLALL